MKQIAITIPDSVNDIEAMALKVAIQKIAKNFNLDNVKYIAELSEKANVNTKFENLKKNPFVKSLL